MFMPRQVVFMNQVTTKVLNSRDSKLVPALGMGVGAAAAAAIDWFSRSAIFPRFLLPMTGNSHTLSNLLQHIFR